MSVLNKLKNKKKEKVKTAKKDTAKVILSPLVSSSLSASKSLIRQAWVTEKAGSLSGFGKYVFVVDKKANKSEIKKAIESIYGVKVININTINIKGKAKRLGRSLGKTSAFKKAVATLKQGQKIDVMPA